MSSESNQLPSPCANPQCPYGGMAASTHKCSGCQKNIHMSCGKLTDNIVFVLCPVCQGPTQQQDNSPPARKRRRLHRKLPEPSPEHVGTTLERRTDEPGELTLLLYHDALADFMSFRDKKTYYSCHPFPISELCKITAKQVAAWLAFKAYGKEHPLPTDNPTKARATTLRKHKVALSYFLPDDIRNAAWNDLTMRGNPANSKEVRQLMKMVRTKEAQDLGKAGGQKQAMAAAAYQTLAPRPASEQHPTVPVDTAATHQQPGTSQASETYPTVPADTADTAAATTATLPQLSAGLIRERLLMSLLLSQANELQRELWQAKQEIVALRAEHKSSHQEIVALRAEQKRSHEELLSSHQALRRVLNQKINILQPNSVDTAVVEAPGNEKDTPGGCAHQ